MTTRYVPNSEKDSLVGDGCGGPHQCFWCGLMYEPWRKDRNMCPRWADALVSEAGRPEKKLPPAHAIPLGRGYFGYGGKPKFTACQRCGYANGRHAAVCDL